MQLKSPISEQRLAVCSRSRISFIQAGSYLYQSPITSVPMPQICWRKAFLVQKQPLGYVLWRNLASKVEERSILTVSSDFSIGLESQTVDERGQRGWELTFCISNKLCNLLGVLILRIMKSKSAAEEQRRFSRLSLDCIKKTDLKFIFEILLAEPDKRTIADLTTLVRAMLNIEPVKNFRDFSTAYNACKTMYLAKYKPKSFLYQKPEEAESLYLIISGRVGLYQRNNSKQSDVVLLSEGNCFGTMYNWKTTFLPVSFEETIIAVMPKRDIDAIYLTSSLEKQRTLQQLIKANLFPCATQKALESVSHLIQFNRLAHGFYFLKQGQISKAVFYLVKGSCRKMLSIKDGSEKMLEVGVFSAGDYFPKQDLFEPAVFSFISECPCEVVCIPKKALKILDFTMSKLSSRTQESYLQEMEGQNRWADYKRVFLDGFRQTFK